MAHGVLHNANKKSILPLHSRTDQRKHRKSFYSVPLSDRLKSLLLSRATRRALIGIACLFIFWRLSLQLAPRYSKQDIIEADLVRRKEPEFNEAELSRLGITKAAPGEQGAKPVVKDQAVPIPQDVEVATAKHAAIPGTTEIIIEAQEETPLPAQSQVPLKVEAEKRWAKEGADGVGLRQLTLAISHLVRDIPVVMFSKTTCPYSKAAKALLDSKGLASHYFVVEANLRSDTIVLKQALAELTHHSTFPNVHVGGRFVGGSDQLHALEKEGKLDGLLSKAGLQINMSAENNDQD